MITTIRDDAAQLEQIWASSSATYYRAAAAQARTLRSLTTTPKLKRYLAKMITRYEQLAVDVEA